MIAGAGAIDRRAFWRLRERCGESEEVHSALKSDLAGGRMPSGLFGTNAARWALSILAFNLNAAMKRLALDEGWTSERMKALRFHLIGLRMGGQPHPPRIIQLGGVPRCARQDTGAGDGSVGMSENRARLIRIRKTDDADPSGDVEPRARKRPDSRQLHTTVAGLAPREPEPKPEEVTKNSPS